MGNVTIGTSKITTTSAQNNITSIYRVPPYLVTISLLDNDGAQNETEEVLEIRQPSNSRESQAFIYVSAVVIFYGGVLLTLLGTHLCKRHSEANDEDYYTLLGNRDELARRDIRLREKMNVLRIDSIRDGHFIDLIPEHTV